MVPISVAARKPTAIVADVLALPVAGKADAHVGGAAATRELKHRGFDGKPGEKVELGKLAGSIAKHVVAVGIGKPDELDAREAVRRLCGTAVAETKRLGLSTAVIALPASANTEAHGRAAAEGVHLANYRFTAYSDERAKKERRHPLRRVTIAGAGVNLRGLNAGIRRGAVEAEATILARDLVNTPSVDMTPRTLVEHARAVAHRGPEISVTVRTGAQIEKLGMGAFSAVGRGADNPPQFIHLVYRPDGKKEERRTEKGHAGESPRRVVLVGKGLTFDSGGYSIKTAEGMETMKVDMAGAAAVLGVFSVLSRWRPPVEVHGLIAACENLISGRAMKPGDIVRAKNGRTILVENTDAEGRLTLADALSYAVELKPDAIVDLATLTGACIVALGHEVTGLFSNDEALAQRLQAAAAASGEPVWRMPLPTDYVQHIKSDIADLANVGKEGRAGGAISAALFLQEFVGKTPWAHLDIAGPAYAEKQTLPYIPQGGTGFGVRTLLHYLEGLQRK